MAQVTGLDQIIGNLDRWTVSREKRAEQAMAAVCVALEGWAKSEHPYTDRTATNTNSIRAFVAEANAKRVRGILTAGMEYSVLLELAHGGHWAFLLPVIERHKAEIFALLSQHLGGQVGEL